MQRRPLLFWVDAMFKVALVALLLFAVARPDLPQFHGKAVVARALLYPVAALLVPAIWLARGRRDRYPYDVDILVVLPFLVDTAGNALNLYDPSRGGTKRTTSSIGRSSSPASAACSCGCRSGG